MFVVVYTAEIMNVCIFMTCSTSYWFCDKFMDPWNVYVCMYMSARARVLR